MAGIQDTGFLINLHHENLEKNKAAQDTKVKTRHIHQHGQQKICRNCNGSGKKRV